MKYPKSVDLLSSATERSSKVAVPLTVDRRVVPLRVAPDMRTLISSGAALGKESKSSKQAMKAVDKVTLYGGAIP